MIDHIQKSCELNAIESPTIIYKDNATCVAQMQTGYIKTNYTKHISPKLFYPHELQKSGEISILRIKSCDNLADLFTKSHSHCAGEALIPHVAFSVLGLDSRSARISLNLLTSGLI
jgi:hypothetical protein